MAALSKRLTALLTALAFAAAATAATAQPVGDPILGQRLYLQCRACHTVGPSEPSGVGPNLYGVMGAKVAAKADYKYSPALAASGLDWTFETMDAWLKRPTALVPDTKMAFAGVADAQARSNLIAYLYTLKPTGAAPKAH